MSPEYCYYSGLTKMHKQGQTTQTVTNQHKQGQTNTNRDKPTQTWTKRTQTKTNSGKRDTNKDKVAQNKEKVTQKLRQIRYLQINWENLRYSAEKDSPYNI